MSPPSPSRPQKTVKERAEEVMLSDVLSGDMMRMMGIASDPVMCRKYLADVAAGDIEKYAPMNPTPNYGSLEQTLDSPITPQNRCHFCNGRPSGTNLLRCTACKAVRYCGRECQSKDWKFHKKGCALIRSDPKGLGENMVSGSSAASN